MKKTIKALYLSALAILLIQCTPKLGQVEGTSNSSVTKESFRAAAPSPAAAPEIQLGSYDKFSLDNGLTVIVVENNKLPRVSYQVFLDIPPIPEGEKAGVSDLAGDLMSRGTDNRTKSEIDEAIDFIGANFSSFSNGFYGTSLTKHQDKLLEVMSDVLKNPSFPEEEFEKIKTQTLSDLAQAQNDPNSLSSRIGRKVVYGEGHPYGELTTESSIQNISVEDCRSYYNTFFNPGDAYLIVVGDIDASKAKQKAQKFFGDWNSKSNIPDFQFETPESPGERAVSIVNKEGAVQSIIRLSYPYELKPGDNDAIPVSVLNTLLGGFFNSRVNLNLREDKGYTYGAGTSLGTDRYVASFVGSAAVRNEVTDSAIAEFLKEIETLQTELVSDDELDLVKSVVMGNFALSLERPQTIANFALNTARYNLDPEYYHNYLKKVESITPEDIREMANKYLQPYDLHILVVGNKDDIEGKLVVFDDSGDIDFYDTEGNRIENKNLAIPAGLNGQKVIENYINAVDPNNQRHMIENLSLSYTMEAMGTMLEMKSIYAKPNKFYLVTKAQGMELSKQVYNGEEGYVAQMGQAIDVDSATLEELKSQAAIIPEEEYISGMGTKVVLKSVEEVDGVQVYKLTVQNDAEETAAKTLYFDATSGLKVREVSTNNQQGQEVSITQEFKDYKVVNGIMVPHTVITSGAFPVPLEAKLVKATANTDIDMSVFEFSK